MLLLSNTPDRLLYMNCTLTLLLEGIYDHLQTAYRLSFLYRRALSRPLPLKAAETLLLHRTYSLLSLSEVMRILSDSVMSSYCKLATKSNEKQNEPNNIQCLVMLTLRFFIDED